jgi:hypothetical protein
VKLGAEAAAAKAQGEAQSLGDVVAGVLKGDTKSPWVVSLGRSGSSIPNNQPTF